MDKPKKNKVEEELAKGQQIHNQDTEGDEAVKDGRIPVFDSVNSIKKQGSGDLNGSGEKTQRERVPRRLSSQQIEIPRKPVRPKGFGCVQLIH